MICRTLRNFATTAALAAAVTATGASAATAPSLAEAILVSPLSVTKTSDLDFGTLIASGTAGTATVNATTGARTTAGGTTAGGGSPTAARFTAAGRIGALALISLPGSIVLTRGGGTETMTVNSISSNGPTLRLFPGTATIDVAVGGTLNVAANQVSGVYVGTFVIDVIYL